MSVGHPTLQILVFSWQINSEVFNLTAPGESGNKQCVVCPENTWADLVHGFLNVLLHPKATVDLYDLI